MMLTSGSQPRDAARCREVGITSYLTKPVKQAELLNAMCTAIHAAAGDAPAPLALPQVAPVQSYNPLHILLVEDNAINQRLTRWMLEKWGHAVVIASTGREALAALARETFALVLMDVQMSDLDGFATTAIIRQQEQATGAHIPIVALTAHAMPGDRERCLAAGMDAYLSKPLQSQQLLQVIEQLVPAAVRPPEAGPSAEPAEAVFDRHAALARVHGDSEMLQDIVGLFFAETPALLCALREAITRGDGQALTRVAHSLQGTVSSFGAPAARAAALRLEALGRGGDVTHAEPACAALEREIARLAHALAAFRGEQAT